MKVTCTWTEKLKFTATAGNNSVFMDAKPPFGQDTAVGPKELLLSSLCGCSAMDIVSLMRKYRQTVEAFEIVADGTFGESTPKVFVRVDLVFAFTGPIEKEKAIESVQLSQNKYCGVSKMLAQAFPIYYVVVLNGEQIADGQAHFDEE